jgi:2-methylisocitrate lyase-like PEP mutase family enzyme
MPKQLSPTDKRRKFRALLKRKKMTVMPGGFSPLYARLAQEAGHECFFMAGSQLSAFLYGVPDNGIIGLRDVADHARHMAARCDIPILIDGDTGYGNAVNVHFAVQEMVRAGVAAMSLEDQEAPKKSAISAGRRVVSTEEHVGKIRAAVAARDEIDPEFVVCARCDLLGAEGSNFDDTLERCITYVEKGGADLIWLNSVESRDDLRRACKEIPAPVLVIWGGRDLPPTNAEFDKMGVRIALYPTFCATAGLQTAWELLHEVKTGGARALAEFNVRAGQSKWGKADQGALVQVGRVRQIEERYLPKEAQRDYAGTWGHKSDYSDALKTSAASRARTRARSS